jgi:FtsP/CotA-like multicopper oxidase with cupredoxin domain
MATVAALPLVAREQQAPEESAPPGRTRPHAGPSSTVAPPPTTSVGTSTSSAPAAPVAPPSAVETWTEPWVWRPGQWPGQSLALNVVENQNPGAIVGYGNQTEALFSYGGTAPGPTIRMRGDETLSIDLRNLLGLDTGRTFVGEFPDPNELTGYVGGEELTPQLTQQLARDLGNERYDFCLGEHTNGVHTVHTTNLHTHGLHVRPGRNPDGTHSDNVILRLLPQADLSERESIPLDGSVPCRFLRAGDQIDFLADDEQVGRADFEFRLGDVQGDAGQPHPPGTFWYHPHSHGATHDQVASGMAGFLIVEGDVDDAIRAAIVPDRANDPGDPAEPTGPSDYRERLMLMQRVFQIPTDPDAQVANLRRNAQSSGGAPDTVNGSTEPSTIVMRPRATERWRALNGSVDGKGFRRFMVLKGRYGVDARGHLVHVASDGTPGDRVTRGEAEAAKQQLHQLAFDGITLVSIDGTYMIKDLAQQGDPGAPFPLASLPGGSPAEQIDRYVECFADGDSIRNCYVRPNEVYLGPANRTDVFFQAPDLDAGEEAANYCVVALGVILHADTPLQGLQQQVYAPWTRQLDGTPTQTSPPPPQGPGDLIIANLVVTGQQAEAFDLRSIELPDVPSYLRPIGDDDPGLAAPDGGFRTRVVSYSGWGAEAMPLITATLEVDGDGNPTAVAAGDDASPTSAAFAEFILDHPELDGLRYARRFPPVDGRGEYVLLAPNIRTMAIDGRKFDPNDPARPRMFLDSAEEWAVYNVADLLWGDTDGNRLPPSQYKGHYDGEPVTLADGMARFRDDPAQQLLTRAVDHPFHIHQNPFWVIRIDVPGADGQLHNILDQPTWMDSVPLPRHRGRVVMRSRFADYVGTYVHHCHILLHEDNGMMQAVEVTPFDRRDPSAEGEPADVDAARANYEIRHSLATGGTDTAATQAVNALYPRPTLVEGYVSNMTFLDPNESTGQSYPGFPIS